MIILKKSDLVKAFKFASLAGNFANIEFDNLNRLNIHVFAYDNTHIHSAIVQSDQSISGEFQTAVNVSKILDALKSLNSEIEFSLDGDKLVLSDETLTFEIATFEQSEERKPAEIKKDASIHFPPLPLQDLRIFLGLAKRISDNFQIHVDQDASFLRAESLGDEVILNISSLSHGKAQATYSTELLSKPLPFLKSASNAWISIQDDGPLSFEIEYNGNLTLEGKYLNMVV